MDSINSKGLPSRMIPIAISVIVILVFILFTPAPSSGDAQFYSIALSRFSSEEAAKKEEASLKNSGNNAFYRKEKNQESGKIEYQVYIERYSSMEEATKEAKVLKDLELISDYLVKKVVDTPVIEEPPPETRPEPAEAVQPGNDIEQVSERKSGVTENKAPEPESKIIEGQNPPAVKKDTEVKIPDSVTREKEVANTTVDTGSKNIKTPLPPAEKRLNEKDLPETVPKEQEIKTAVPEQGKGSGQVIRGSIPSQKKTVKQGAVTQEPEGQAPSTNQSAATDKVPKAEKIDTQKQEAADIIRDETVPVKSSTDAASQTPDEKGPEPLKTPDISEPHTANAHADQPKGATLQVGAYKEEANAAILKKQLLSLGRTAFYRHEKAEGLGDLYRIYITGYKTLGEAVKDAKTLVESGVIKGYARPSSKFSAADIPPEKAVAAESEAGGRIIFLHTGSFKEEVNAQRAVASLKGSGYKAFLVPEKESSVTWYRVYVGDFRSETQAREKGMELLEKGIITYFKPVSIDPQENGN